ncbi:MULTISPECIES: hypothetical protein [unclassified Halomonas]|uniref:hypothetical protein n=1 Tax=unclassified Halomonas TaxID=2609666 RepID=UPI001C99E16D|nr:MULTISPECIES: hypothetical protein [unclassified Halomonas]MBY5942403.1 hypothetical protein [Halomonas sp. DP5N14-9]MCJ8286114.1 hypothetical protein [Halomonas sp.]NQY71166.1 hypothetical protein [Halomonas sp.]
MLELTPDQERRLRISDQAVMVQEALDVFRNKLPRIYDKLGHDTLSSRLSEGYTTAVVLGLTKKALVFKYMLYGVSAPKLRNAAYMKEHFQKSSDTTDLVAMDLFSLLAFRPTITKTGRLK